MDDNDPITQFFPGEEETDLYAVLSLDRSATVEAVKKAYRRLALVYHPDKHASASDQAKEDASTKFQQIGFAYTVLSDEKRKARYDSIGKTDERFELGAGEDGWEAYFEELFDRVTRGTLDEMKREYQGSVEEVADLINAYQTTGGSLGELMTYIPHSTHEDEIRFIAIINDLIKKERLDPTHLWLSTSEDEKAKLARKKKSEKEAKEAEAMAKSLGVWDEFYGNGKPTEKKSKRKGVAKDGEDHSVLQALILKKKQMNRDSFFDNLAAKYSEPSREPSESRKCGSRAKGKKRDHVDIQEEELPKKKSRMDIPPPPEIGDAEFAELQEKLFGDCSKKSSITASAAKSGQKHDGKSTP
ncbi:DnaJ-domain-containing protein [Pholiota conissans]|uniref:DnaJ-domain-containing protein n=1 Tax=Pholiota conissans TaxID=109636 RepID=A0A9P5Z9S5_9AGAR|nr:DnaJ-domain-containing protein [Pholiota conissans]